MSDNSIADYHLSLFRRAPGRRPYILGHRGAPLLVPENTIASFHRALDEGADGVELDVRMSADGQLILSHDNEVFVPGRKKKIALHRLTWSQIRALPRGHGEPMARLRDALSFQAETGARLNVELKGDVPAPGWMTKQVSAQIGAHGGANVIVSSFSPLIILYLSRWLPHVPRGLLFDKDQSWMKRVLPLSLLGAQAAHPEAVLIDSDLVKRVRCQVPLLNAWTVNDPKLACRLAALGVDTLITDEIALIRGAF